MWHRLLGSASFHRRLFSIDEDIAALARAGGCPVCGAVVHSASYPRKPRGGLDERGPQFDRRHSFCCAAGDCRKRLTPPSVRFLDRRVYLGVVVTLAVVLAQGLDPRRTRRLCRDLDVDRRSLERWRQWWQEEVPRTGWWADLRGRLDRPPDPGALPGSLLERLRGEDEEARVLRLLHLLEPLSHSALMRRRLARVA